MINCQNCGAANKPGSQVCRMCATELVERAVDARNTPAAVITQEGIQQEGTVDQQGIACPSCNTMNEKGWSFCQQCGGRLPQAGTNPSDWKTQVDFNTTPTPQPEVPAPEPPPSSPPAGQGDAGGALPTVVAQPSSQPPAAAPAQSQPPAPPAAGPQMTEVVQSTADSVTCSQCGQTSSLRSAFCANCGSPLTVPKTVVMSSPYAPLKAKLHLVMEGGQLGEVYELGEETVIGRTNGNITFPHDGFMSGRHAKVVRRGSSFILMDEGSRNGTFVRIKGEVELKPGDMVLVGKQLFRFEV